MKKVLGITGGIASGKSTVSNYLMELGFTVIDADVAAREVVMPGQEAYKKIIEHFGPEILLDDLTINRPLLGSIIFNDKEKRMLLNSSVHPDVRKWMIEKKEHAFASGQETVFMDIPLLFESKLTHMVDLTILVYVNEENQLKRLMERNNLTKEEAEARIKSQMPLSEKIKLADAVIDNNGSLDETIEQVHEVLTQWNVLSKTK